MDNNQMAVLGLGADEERIYRHFLRNPRTTVEDIHLLLQLSERDVEQHVTHLTRLGLLRQDTPQQVIPVDPVGGVARLIDQRLEELHEEIRQVTTSHRLTDSLSAEQHREAESPHGVEQLEDLSAIRARIADLAFFARQEVLSVEPYEALRPEYLEQARPLDLRCLNRGLSVRSIVLRQALQDPDTVAYLRELESHGARIRVVDETSERILIYDRREAVVPVDPSDTARGALVAREEGLVSNLIALFERIWDQARDLSTELGGTTDTRPALSPVEQQVFVSMCSGDKDEVNARDIGLSVRTYRRHVAELMQLLGASNRAQAALLARDRGWV